MEDKARPHRGCGKNEQEVASESAVPPERASKACHGPAPTIVGDIRPTFECFARANNREVGGMARCSFLTKYDAVI